MKNLTLIKLGGSLITHKDKPFTERLNTIKRLSKDIARAKRSNRLFIVGHGGGSYPHVPAVKYRINEGIVNKDSCKGIALVQDAAARLNRIVVSQFILSGENAISVSPSSFMIMKNGKVNKVFIKSLEKYLEHGMLPVVYGDVGADLIKGCTIISTEQVLNYLALKLEKAYKISQIVYCGITDGVLDNNGKTIKRITAENFDQVEKDINHSAGIDSTGGMIHKVKEALAISQKGVDSVIINGDKNNNLYNLLQGNKYTGTLVTA